MRLPRHQDTQARPPAQISPCTATALESDDLPGRHVRFMYVLYWPLLPDSQLPSFCLSCCALTGPPIRYFFCLPRYHYGLPTTPGIALQTHTHTHTRPCFPSIPSNHHLGKKRPAAASAIKPIAMCPWMGSTNPNGPLLTMGHQTCAETIRSAPERGPSALLAVSGPQSWSSDRPVFRVEPVLKWKVFPLTNGRALDCTMDGLPFYSFFATRHESRLEGGQRIGAGLPPLTSYILPRTQMSVCALPYDGQTSCCWPAIEAFRRKFNQRLLPTKWQQRTTAYTEINIHQNGISPR